MNKIKESQERNRAIFDSIAHRYDLLNHLLSAGIDRYWRRQALVGVSHSRPAWVLDLATGTADFAIAACALRPQQVVGIDLVLKMLCLGRDKVRRQGREGQVTLLVGDAEELPFRDACFELVIAAFGVRNFGCIPAGLAEAFRVLLPGGEIRVLDFSWPSRFPFRQIYSFYLKRIFPVLGGLISGNRQAYAYLPQSVDAFPQGAEFAALLEGAGFVQVKVRQLTWGICSVYQGHKPGRAID